MTDPTERPENGSISAATARAVQADRARVVAAEQAARRRRSSILGRLERGLRWLRNRQSGPVPRARRVASVLRATLRDKGPWRDLPEALATALLAPVRLPGKPPPPKPPRDWEPARAAAADRLAAFTARPRSARPRIALIADDHLVEAYRDEAAVVLIRPEDWVATLSAQPPDLLVVDAPHDGNRGAWAYRVAWTAHPDFFLQRDLEALTSWCAARSIPTVFRAREGGALGTLEWRDAARLVDLVVAPDADAERAFEGQPDRRGVVRRAGLPIGDAGSELGPILLAVRAGT